MTGSTVEMGAGSRTARWERWWWLIALPIAVGLWWGLGPFIVTRELRVRVPEAGAERARNLSVRWDRADGGGSGAWVDWSDEHGVWTQRMPARGVREVRLEWPPVPDAAARPAVQIGVTDRVCGVAVGRTQSEEILAASGGSVRVPVPPSWRAFAAELALVYGVFSLAGWGWTRLRVPEGTSDGAEAAWTRAEQITLGAAGVVFGLLLLTSPMMFCPDSMDYAVRARELLETGSFSGFDAWRPPGFAVLLAGLTRILGDFTGPLRIVHWAMAVLTMGMAGSIVRRFAGPRWGKAAILVVGLDPLMSLWSRHVMPEMTGMFLTTLAAWLVVRASRGMVRAALVGVAAGLASYMRGNLQVLAPVLAVMMGLAVPNAVRFGWGGVLTRRLALVAACVLGAGVLLAPWIARNGEVAGMPRFVIGMEFARLLNAADAGLIDMNQTAVFGRGEIGADKGGDDGYAVARRVHGSAWGREGPYRDGAGLHRWASAEARLGVVVGESLDRRPDGAWRARGEAFLSLSALAPLDRTGYRENAWWARPLEGDAAATAAGNFWNRPEDYAHLDRARAVGVYEACHEEIAPYQADWGAWLFRWWMKLGRWVRTPLAWAGLLGCVWAARRGNWGAAVLLGVPFVHAGAVAMVTLSGIDRYQAPLGPLTLCGGVITLSWVVRAVLGRTAPAVTGVTEKAGGAG